MGLLGRRNPGWYSTETAKDPAFERRKKHKEQEYYNTTLYAGCRMDRFNLWRNTFKDWKHKFIGNTVNTKYQNMGYKTYKLNPGYCIDISQYNFNNPNHEEYNKWFFNKEKPRGRYEKKMGRAVSQEETKKLIINKFGTDVYDVFVSAHTENK